MVEANVDPKTVKGFGREWASFDHEDAPRAETRALFENYFRLFPWEAISKTTAVGADFGCGSGRWAQFVLPRVGTLHLVDASAEALDVAKRKLASAPNARFHHASVENAALPELDFAYSLGVLHHMPDTAKAIADIARVMKPGAPFLLYLYYALDNRPFYFRALWRMSSFARLVIARLPYPVRFSICQLIAALVYWPFARVAKMLERFGALPEHFPLAFYRDLPFYFLRNDALDRFGTALEQRFTPAKITAMLNAAGFGEIKFMDATPYWCCISYRKER